MADETRDRKALAGLVRSVENFLSYSPSRREIPLAGLHGAIQTARAALPPEPGPTPEGRVTRVEVIDDTGRVYTRWSTSVTLSYQDEGRTLKVFVGPSEPASPAPTPGVTAFSEAWENGKLIKPSPEPAQDGARETPTLPRYGIAWDGPRLPIGTPMPDGYWTPWHTAQSEITRLRSALAQAQAEIVKLAPVGMDYGTHWDGCHEARGHHDCALAKLAQAEQERDKAVAQIHRWYREGVETAASGNPIPSQDDEGGKWRARGFQWMAANLERQSLKAERDDARREAAALLARISGAL